MTINWHGLLCEHGFAFDRCLDCLAASEDALERMDTHLGDYQFVCDVHQYGWSIDEDGRDSGCMHCAWAERSELFAGVSHGR